MARFSAYKARPIVSPLAHDENSSIADGGWNTLDELRQSAMAKGCTKAQFDHAIEVVGSNPYHVATYLQRHSFTPAA